MEDFVQYVPHSDVMDVERQQRGDKILAHHHEDDGDTFHDGTLCKVTLLQAMDIRILGFPQTCRFLAQTLVALQRSRAACNLMW